MVKLVKLTEQKKDKAKNTGGSGQIRLVKLNEQKKQGASEELKREAALKRARDLTTRMQTPEKIQLQKEAAQKRSRDMVTRFENIEQQNVDRLARQVAQERREKTGGNGVLGLLAMAGKTSDSTLPLSGSGQVALDLNSSPAQLAYDKSMAKYREAEIARAQAAQTEKMKQWAAENPLKGSVASVATGLMSGAEALAELTAFGVTGELMPGGNDFSPTAATMALRKGASGQMGDTGKFVYNTGMSALDSLVSNEVLLGLSAASSAIQDVKARGGTDRQAVVSGVFAGLAESFFEHASLGQLRALADVPVDGVKTLLKNMRNQAFVNFTEETFTELANILFDTGFMGELSNYALLAEQYMREDGLSEREAKNKALWELTKQVGSAGLSGALMGLGFGTLGSAQGYMNNRALGISAQTRSGVEVAGNRDSSTGDLEALRRMALAGDAGIRQMVEKAAERNEAAETGTKTETAGQSAPAAMDKYPNLQKLMRGESVEPNTAAAEAMNAVKDGIITQEQGLELTRQALTGQYRQQAATVEQTPALEQAVPEQQRPNVEQKAPGFYGEATKAERKRLDRLAKAVGLSIERVPAAEAGDREGWIIGGRAYLSEQTEDPLWVVAKHEVTHYLQEMAGEAYNEFRSYVEDVYRQRGSLEARLQSITEKYQKIGQELTAEEALDELAANYAGELLDNEALIRRLAGEKPGLAQWVQECLQKLLEKLRGALGGEEYRRLDEAAKLWEKALVETNRAYYQEGKRASTDRERNAISKTTNGKRFVEVEEDILAGVPEEDWISTVKDNLKKKFPNGIAVGNNEIVVDGQSRKELTYSKYMQWLYNHDPQLQADKLRATNNADEILIAASEWVNEGLNHPRKDRITDFARGSVLIRIGNNDYSAEVVVGMRKNGTMLLYDVLNLQPATFEKKEADAAISTNPSPGAASSTASDSGDRIPQERKSVKGVRDLQKQIDRLERQNKRLQEQMKISNLPKPSRKAVEQQAAELRKAYSSGTDKNELSDRLENLYTAMHAQSGGKGKRTMSWSEIHQEAKAIADEILANSRGNVNPKAEEYADLRKELRSRKLYLSEEYRGDLESVGGYNELRKRSMGGLTLSGEGTPVDVVYQELSDKYPNLFPDDIYHPADQLIRISDVAQELKKVEGNPFEQDLERTAEYLAGEIEERFYELPTEVEAVESQLSRKYEKERQRDRDANSRRLLQQRAAHEQEIREMEERYREENRRRIENQSASERRETIRRHAQRLGRKLIRPTDKQHVPDDMRGAALALVRCINTESAYEWSYGKNAAYHLVKAGTELDGEATSRTMAAIALQKEYAKLEESAEYTVDPAMKDYISEIAAMGGKRVDDMTRAELDIVWKALQVIEHTIVKADEAQAMGKGARISALAEALLRDNGSRKDRRTFAVPGLKNVDSLINENMLTPETWLHKLGETGDLIYRQMRAAADRQTVILKEGTDRARKLIEESGVSFKKADKELHTFEVKGGEITLSTGQLMELYALSKRKQALDHIYEGGLKPVEARDGLYEVGSSEPVKVTPNDVAEMVSALTPEQKKLMDGLQEYLSGDLAGHGNEASRAVYGYSKFTEESYWPIKVSSAEVASDPTKAAASKTIPNYGMTKTPEPKASNAVELRSAIDTYSSHLNQMATYAAWLGINEDLTKLVNYKFKDGETVNGTVKRVFERVYGKSGSKYLENLMADIAQGTKAGADKSFPEQGLSKFKAAKVGGNLRVIIQQPTAILRAMEMVDPKYFATAKDPIKGWQRAKEYSPIAQWKDWGYFEIDTGRSLRELMTGTENSVDKWKNRMMAPAGWADSVAWGHLWNAVEKETADKRPELTAGSKAFYEAVAERFGEVVDRTQVVDSVLHRTQIMRSSNYANKMLTSFMSEPSKVYNMVARDVYELRAATSEEARKKAGKRLGRSTAALITSFAVNALAQSFVDGLRDDDREKKYWDKVADNWAENFTANFNPMGYIPYVKDVQSLLQGYTLERSDMEGIADAIKAIQQLERSFKGKTEKSVLAAGLDAASKLGDMLGLPVSNLRRDAGAIFHTVMNGIGAGRELYKWDKLKYNPETAMGIFQNDLYRAMDTDWGTYEMIYGDIMAELQEQGKNEEEAADSIKKAVEERMKKALGLNSVTNLPFRYSPPGENEEFDAYVKAAIDKNTSWEDELPEDVVELAQDLDEQKPEKTERVLMIASFGMEQGWAEVFLRETLSEREVAQYDACRKAGVTMKEWAEAYSAIGGAAYQRTGKRSASQEDVKTALGKMNLSNAKRTAIWNSYGYKTESPWG